MPLRFVMAAQSSTRAFGMSGAKSPHLWPARGACAIVARMGIASQQNMIRAIPQSPKPYGVRVRLKAGDPFARLLGADWQTTHWYYTLEDRDAALTQMARRHEYSRIGDEPALVFEKVENLAQSRWL